MMEPIIPPNCFYDAETESFINTSQYTDVNGNLVAPPGYSFVTAEVSQPAPPRYVIPQQSPHYMFYPGPSNVAPPQYHQQYSRPHGRGYHRPTWDPQHNPSAGRLTKEDTIKIVYEAIKERMQYEKKWVDIRDEDEGYYTVRMHIKKRTDLVRVPMIIQDIVTKGWCTQFSMHYIRKNQRSRISGISFYIRLRGESEVIQTIDFFANVKIHSKRVGTPEQKKTKRVRDTPDEDPDLPDSEEETAPEAQKKRFSSGFNSKKNKSKSVSLLSLPSYEKVNTKNRTKSRRSTSLLLVPNPPKQRSLCLVPNHEVKRESTMELTFEDGSKKVVKVKQPRAKSSCLIGTRKGKTFSLECAK